MSEYINSNDDKISSTEAPVATKAVAPRRSLTRLWLGLGIGTVLAVAIFILGYSPEVGVVVPLVLAYFMLAFGASLTLEESAVREIICWMATRTLAFPGLIWEFSLDGFMWLIGMKLLFWVIGLVFGVLCAILGVVVAVIVAPFSYPFNLISYIKDGD